MGLFSSQIATRQMVPVCRQLATSYSAGISMIDSLDTIADTTKDPSVRRAMGQMAVDLRNGATLDEAAQSQTRYLPPFFVALLASGEQGGRLDVTLGELTTYYEDRLAMQRQVVSLMTIPILQLAAAWFLGTFALGLADIATNAFAGGGGGGVSGVQIYIGDYIAFQTKALIAFAAAGCGAVVLSRMGLLRWITGLVSTFVWPLSAVTRRIGLARFFKSMALMIASGVGLTKCIESSAAVMANPYMEKEMLKSLDYIKGGNTLTEAFSRSRFLTRMAHNMLAVGEKTGNLENQCNKIAEYHFQEAEHAMGMATKVFGVLIILGVCLVVGSIIISFYAQLYGGIIDGLGI